MRRWPLLLLVCLCCACAARRTFTDFTAQMEQRTIAEERSAAELLRQSEFRYRQAAELNDLMESLILADLAFEKDEKPAAALRIAAACAILGEKLPHAEARSFLRFGLEKLDEIYPQQGTLPAGVLYWRGVLKGLLAQRYGERLTSIQGELLDLWNRSLQQQPDYLCGAAQRELCRFYRQSPAWPLGFGDVDKAAEMAAQALRSCPEDPENLLLPFEVELARGSRSRQTACLRLEQERAKLRRRIDAAAGRFWRGELIDFLERLRNECKRTT